MPIIFHWARDTGPKFAVFTGKLFNCKDAIWVSVLIVFLLCAASPLTGQVLNGIDTLKQASFKPLQGLNADRQRIFERKVHQPLLGGFRAQRLQKMGLAGTR